MTHSQPPQFKLTHKPAPTLDARAARHQDAPEEDGATGALTAPAEGWRVDRPNPRNAVAGEAGRREWCGAEKRDADGGAVD
jgi:hypothetical protein